MTEEKTLNEMRNELDLAGCTVSTVGDSFSYPKETVCIIFPDGLRLSSPYYMPIEREIMYPAYIEKAYAHLQKERKFEAMEALITRLIEMKYESIEYAPHLLSGQLQEWHITNVQLKEFVEEAKRLLEE